MTALVNIAQQANDLHGQYIAGQLSASEFKELVEDLKIVHDDEFSVNRRTAEMTTFRKWVSNGITSSITYGKLKCRKVDQKF